MIVRIDKEEAEHIWTGEQVPWIYNGTPAERDDIDFNDKAGYVVFEMRSPEKKSIFLLASIDELIPVLDGIAIDVSRMTL